MYTCSNCKKTFAYDKYNGVCPGCGRYHRKTTAVQDHQEYHDRYDDGYNHSEQDDHDRFHQKYDTSADACRGFSVEEDISSSMEDVRNKLKSYIVPGVVLFILNPVILIIAIVIVCVKNKDIAQYMKQQLENMKKYK